MNHKMKSIILRYLIIFLILFWIVLPVYQLGKKYGGKLFSLTSEHLQLKK